MATTTIGEQLRTLRGQHGISRAKLAGLAGCSPTFLGNIEAGYTPKNSPALNRALAALHDLERPRPINSEGPGRHPGAPQKSASGVAVRDAA